MPHPATLVTLGNLHDPHTLLAVFGLLATSALLARRVPAAMLIGILLTTVVGIAAGLVHGIRSVTASSTFRPPR